ncbi:MAG: hypothetical protein ACXVZW_05235 [Gaiellaceae bacterium]
MPYNRFDPGFHGAYHHGGAHPLLWVIFAVLIAVLVLLLLSLAGRLGRQRGWQRLATAGAGAEESLAALRLRYARGEIDRDQFLQVSRDLGLPPGPGDAPTGVQPPPS